MNLQTKTHKLKPIRGFTLIELIVVIGIMTLITSVLLANYGKFGSKMLLRNLTYDLALTIREAQVYGISGKFQESDTFTDGIPIIIGFDSTGAKPPFYMFSDIGGDWEQTLVGEKIGDYNLGRGFRISSIWANEDSIRTGIDKVAIAFRRPEPDAEIRDQTSTPVGTKYDNIRIIVESPKGEQLSVFVESAGQISVQKVTP